MPRFNRILGFVSVSFVLVFLGKISKTDLYTAYFKTIADVEVRNSQDMSEVGFVLNAVFDPAPEIPGPLPLSLSSGLPQMTAPKALRKAVRRIASHFEQAPVYYNPHHFLVVAPTRAPGQRA